MVQQLEWRRVLAWPRYWFLILAGAVGLLVLYAVHLATGFVPDRIAFAVFGLPVYWYGILIAASIGLGCYVVAELATARAQQVFAEMVPAAVAERPLSGLTLPDDLQTHLQQRDLITLGELLWSWGTDPARISLPNADRERLATALTADPTIAAEWIEEPAWGQWSADHVWNGLLVCLILGLIGARLYHVLTPSPSMTTFSSFQDYLNNPVEIFNLRRGGLGIYGGIAGGALGVWWYTRRARLPLWGWLDLAVIGLALGQAFGRWANFFNQELYGRPTDLPWAVQIDPAFRLPAFAEFSAFHPAFLYESLWSLATFLLLFWLYHNRRTLLKPGELTALYFVAYGIGRSLVELVRLDSRSLFVATIELPVATAVSLTLVLLMVLWVGGRRWLNLKRET
jgi:phosphatidylglycerol---prolipoprotein diacylglyceryl transferase